MFRDLIPNLADRYHVIAPDLPGFGNTVSLARGDFTYSFDNLAEVIAGFVEALRLVRFALYIFDYGAPVGLRIATRFPERIAAIVTQNGKAYVEGFSDAWGTWQTYWRDPTPEHREACRVSVTPETIREWPYINGADRERVSPDGYALDTAYTARPGADEIQLDLILDHRTNVDRYLNFRSVFASTSPRCSQPGARTTRTFFPPEQKHTDATFRRRRYTCSKPGTSPWRHITAKSQL